jgi:hypothetical protein
MRVRPTRVTKTPRQHFVLRRDLLSRMMTAGGHRAEYKDRDETTVADNPGDTGSEDDPPPISIDWLAASTDASLQDPENRPDYMFMSIEAEPEEPPEHDFDYIATYRRAPETLELAGEQQTMDDPGEMMASMRQVALTINYRKAVPLTHFYPDEQPLKKELKPGPTLLEAARIDQAITGLDEFL